MRHCASPPRSSTTAVIRWRKRLPAWTRRHRVVAPRTVPALGVEALIDGRLWRLGRADYATGRDDDGGVWLGDGVRAVGTVRHSRGAAQRCRGGASPRCSADGLTVELCSGDAAPAVQRFAHAVGIADAKARLAPEQKLEHVRELQARGHVVAMIGDGLNDAPVLAGADVSLAMAEGAALAQRAADFVVTSPSLLRIPQAMALARRTQAIVRQNVAWALGYNLLALPLAASGLVTPWLAAIGMAASSLLVTLNALRLCRVPSAGRSAP